MPETPSFWTVLSMLNWATAYFEEKEVNSPRLSIEWLLSHVLEVKRLDLYLNYDRPLSPDELARLRPMVKRRAAHEPLQYITGETSFRHATIKVNPSVLIPRPETEELAGLVLDAMNADEIIRVLDIGTGSGCIPVALKIERPEWQLHAFDISDEALSVANDNAALNNVEVHFYRDDILNPTQSDGSVFDAIVSNPPYILPEEQPALDKEVAAYEPKEALFCETTQSMYGSIEQFAWQHLKNGGRLFLELNAKTAQEVLRLFGKDKWKAEIKTDFNDKPRFLAARKH